MKLTRSKVLFLLFFLSFPLLAFAKVTVAEINSHKHFLDLSSIHQKYLKQKHLKKNIFKPILINELFSSNLDEYRKTTFEKWKKTTPKKVYPKNKSKNVFQKFLPFLKPKIQWPYQLFDKGAKDPGGKEWKKIPDEEPETETMVLKMSIAEQTQPDIAYNWGTGNHFVVWTEAIGESGSGIFGDLRNLQGDIISAEPFLISPEACLPGDFFERFNDPKLDYSQLSLPTTFSGSIHPAVTYNPIQDRYLVVWECRMVADYPDNFPFSVVLGMQYREEGSVLISEWDEPALLNRYFLALSLPKNYSAPYVLQSKNVLAWSSAETPDIAASHHQDHSVVVYSTNTPNSLADVMNYGSNPTKLQYMLQHFGIHLRPIVSNTLPLPTPKTFSRLSEGLSFETPRVEYHGIQEQFMTVFGVRDFDNNSSGIGGIPFAVTESEAVNSPESAVVLVDWGLAGQHASRPDIIAHDKDSDSHFTTVYRADKNDFKGIQGLYFNLSDAINMSHFSYVEDWGPFTNEVPKISYSFGSSSIPNTGHLLTFERGYNIYGSFLKDGEVNPDQPFLISSEPAIINQLPALVFNPYDADEEKFHVVWSQLDGSLFRIVGQDVPLLAPQVIFFEADPPSVQVGQITQLSWETRHAVSVTIEPDVGSGLPFMGDIPTLPLFETTDFTLTASGPGGTTVVPITVVANVFGDPVIAEFNMNPLQVAAGGSVTVSWNVLVEAGDPATVSLLRGSGGEVFADSPTLHGNFPFHPESTDSYTLLVEGVSGTASSDPITVEVVPLVAPTLNPVPNPLAPTRAYLSWDNVGADSYDLYFVQGDSISEGAVPYKTGITETYFVIQSSTDNKPLFESDVGVSPIYLQADTSYSWQIVAHTPDEEASSIIQSFSTDNSVVAWWRFDGDLLDSSGNSNNGVVGAGSTLGFPSGNTNGQALACSGDDYVDLTPIVDNLGFNKSDDYTMEARYKAAGLQGNGVISHPFGSMINIMTPVGSSPSAAIILANDGRLVFDITDVRGSPDLGLYLTVISTSPAYLEESFHHVVGAYQGGSAVSVSTLFVDGNPQAMDSGTLYPFVATDFTRAALCALPQVNAATGESYELGRFNGWLDEVLIYSQTLSEDRVVHNHCAIETLLGTDPLPDICP